MSSKIVERANITWSAGETPDIYLVIKGFTAAMSFSNSLTYYIADGPEGTWYKGKKQAKFGGINLIQPKWFWHLDIDSKVLISCGLNMGTELSLEFYNYEPGLMNFSFRITEQEGVEIRKEIDKMIKQAVADSRVKWKQGKRMLQPIENLISYPVKSLTWEKTNV